MAASKYNKYLIKTPLREVGAGMDVTGRNWPTLTYMSNELVPGCNIYIEFGWIWDKPEPNLLALGGHSHDYDEVVLHIGSDPHNPEYLGAVLEGYMDDEKQITDTTSALYIPKGVKHGPVTWTRVERPHLQMSIVLGTGDFKEAMPGGEELSH